MRDKAIRINVMYQSVPAVNIPQANPRGMFSRGRNPPYAKRLQTHGPLGKKSPVKKPLSPIPWAKQALAETHETVFTTHIFDDVLMQKGISNTPFGSICLINNHSINSCHGHSQRTPGICTENLSPLRGFAS